MKRVIPVLLAFLLVGQSFAGVAAADPVGIFNDSSEEDDGLIPVDLSEAVSIDALSAIGDRIQYAAESNIPFAEPEGANSDAKDVASNVETLVEDNSATLVNYANTEVPDSVNKSNYNTFKIVITKDDSNATRYVHAPVSNGSYDSLDVTSSTSKTIDYTITVEDYAATQLYDEVDWFITEYAEPENEVDGELKATWGATFKQYVSIAQGDA